MFLGSFVFVAAIAFSSVSPSYQCFGSTFLSPIPQKHLFHTKTKPVVLGHRGNPRVYQENSLDGFTSLLETNADGFELDIYLTKDEKLVVFHDDNTKYLTGEDHLMWETNAADLTQVHIRDYLDYNGLVYNFTKRRPLPMLKDVLAAMKDSGKLMYLEMKPSRLRNMAESMKVGKAVATMVTEMGLVNQAMINSFDPFKAMAAKQENPSIPVGFFYTSNYWKPTYFEALRDTFRALPGMKDCVEASPNGTAFIDKMFLTGAAVKAINASFVDMDYKIYDNPLYSNDTFQTLRGNYSPNISAGAWTLYSMKLTEVDDKLQDHVIDSLVRQGAERLITDDVIRLLKKLGRPQAPTTNTPLTAPRGPTAAAESYMAGSHVLLFTLLSVVLFN